MPDKRNPGGSGDLYLQFKPTSGSSNAMRMDDLAAFLRDFSGFLKDLVRHELNQNEDLSRSEARDVKEVCSPLCLPPEAGSYVVPVMLSSPRPDIKSDRVRSIVESHQTFAQDVIEGMGKGDDRLQKVVPDEVFRGEVERWRDVLHGQEQRGVEFRILDNAKKPVYDSAKVPGPKQRSESEHREGSSKVVEYNGVLNSVGVQQKYLKLDSLEGKTLKVPFEDFKALKIPVDEEQLFRVSGIVKPNRQGRSSNVIVLQKLTKIRAVKELAFVRNVVRVRSRTFVADPPLEFHVKYDRRSETFDLSGDLGVRLSVYHASHLKSGLDGMLEVMCRRFALADPEKLMDGGRRLRLEIRDRLGMSSGE